MGQEETATIHYDCFQLYSRYCDAPDKYYRLWLSSVSMHPWVHADNLFLAERRDTRHFMILGELPPPFKRLPVEVLEFVASSVGPTALWRYKATIDRAASLQLDWKTESRTVRLRNIQRWRRDQELVESESESAAPGYVLITMDAGGIAEIESIHEDKWRDITEATPYRAFIIIDKPEQLEEIDAHFQVVNQLPNAALR